jgi:periplasmic copper chaperone A
VKIQFAALAIAALLLFSACGPSTPTLMPTPAPIAPSPTAQPAAPQAQPVVAATPKPTAPAAAIVISDAWTRRSTVAMPPMGATPGSMSAMATAPSALSPTAMPAAVLPNNAVYMVIKNSASTPDKLIKAEFDFATAELHTVEMKAGVMDMHPVTVIDVPATGQVELKPGSFHIMLIGMKKDFAVGDKLDLKLTFASAGMVEVVAEVRAQ